MCPRTRPVLKNATLAALALALLAATACPLLAQQSTPTRQSKSLELESVQRDIGETRRKQAELLAEIKALDRDVGAINRALIASAKRGQALETHISKVEANLAKLTKTQRGLRTSLSQKRGLLSDVIGALQLMGKDPPPALLVLPEDVLTSMRSSMLLGAVVPQIKRETNALFAELTALRQVSQAVEKEKRDLASSLNALAEDEARLTLLVDEKQQLAFKSREDLVTERNKAARLAQRAKSLKELIRQLETQIASAAAAARAARQADERRIAREVERLKQARKRLEAGDKTGDSNTLVPDGSNPARIEPAIAFSKARGTLLQPVSGEQLYGFGDPVDGQKRSKNMAIATRPNARVRSPVDCWVVYAGPFRSYGNILILNAGEKYHMILSGLSDVNVEPGRFVLAGEPIGRMGMTRFAAAFPVDLGSNKPVLSVELRRNGKSIDPAPWWAIRQSAETQSNPKRGT